LQSIIPAPVRWRSSETVFAVNVAAMVLLSCGGVETPPARRPAA
jgi:hypothetical protein